MTAVLVVCAATGNDNKYHRGRSTPHCSRTTQRHKRPLHPITRIMDKFNIHKDNAALHDHARLASAAVDHRSLPPRSRILSCRIWIFIAVFFFFFFYIPIDDSDVIDRCHCKIHKPTAQIGLSRHPARSTLHDYSLRLTFCDRRLNPFLAIDARDDIRPRSGITRDKSSQMFYLFHFLPL